MYQLYQGDCLELMKDIPDNSVDCILCDPPYGMTACEWDIVIDYHSLWKELHRVLKYHSNCILFCRQPFSSRLITSNENEYSHMLYWKKNYITGHLHAKRMPLQTIEEIAVFVCNKQTQNNVRSHIKLKEYMISELEKSGYSKTQIDRLLGTTMWSNHYFRKVQFSIPSKENYKRLQELTKCFNRSYEDIKTEYESELAKSATFNPQGVKDCYYQQEQKYVNEVYGVKKKSYTQTLTNYPKNLLEFDGVKSKDRFHPTQKPVELLEYLVKTYSNEGDTILDFTMGSGSTGVACMNTGRKFIGIEKEEKYFQIAEERIKEASNNLNKFME